MTDYFQTSNGSEHFVYFIGIPIPGSYSPRFFEVFKDFNTTSEDFVKKVNDLFRKYKITIPKNYSKIIIPDDFAICVACCIELEEKYNINAKKIIKHGLIIGDSRQSILHATSLASIALYFARRRHKINILEEKFGQKNPDIQIDELNCEIKTVDQYDWFKDIVPQTGETKEKELSKDLCFDIGKFIEAEDSGHKGIKQADLIFADLSLKSFGLLNKMKDKTTTNYEMPELRKYRIIFFAKRIQNFSSFYIDIDPNLWLIFKNLNTKHKFAIYPFKKYK